MRKRERDTLVGMGGRCAGSGRPRTLERQLRPPRVGSAALQRVAVVRGAAHRRRLGRAARVPSGGCAARGNVWRHRRALEGLALRLRRPMQWRSRSQRRRGGARSPPRARRGARGLPGRAHPSWADSPPCTPSIWAGWVGVMNGRSASGNAKWLSGVVPASLTTSSIQEVNKKVTLVEALISLGHP